MYLKKIFYWIGCVLPILINSVLLSSLGTFCWFPLHSLLTPAEFGSLHFTPRAHHTGIYYNMHHLEFVAIITLSLLHSVANFLIPKYWIVLISYWIPRVYQVLRRQHSLTFTHSWNLYTLYLILYLYIKDWYPLFTDE